MVSKAAAVGASNPKNRHETPDHEPDAGCRQLYPHVLCSVVHARPSSHHPAGSRYRHYRVAPVDGVNIFYREAGPKDGPVVVLLHGFPTSSHMFRNLMPLLADRYRVTAPDYPGLCQSDAPDHTKFAYTFGHYADPVDGGWLSNP